VSAVEKSIVQLHRHARKQNYEFLRAWWEDEVCPLAEQKMLDSGRLEGMHYAAATELLAKMKAEATNG
jgi:hypothetical protein